MRFIKFCLIFSCSAIFCAVLSVGIYFGVTYSKYSRLELDKDGLSSATLAIDVFDSANKPIKDENMFNSPSCQECALQEHTKQAFISIEDKDFYKHKGVNPKRIVKACINNIKSMDLKEGASTISQQLIKNTHLTSEKTFDRKIKEVALAKKLEKAYSKDEILEKYLNVIYFGNNCYGLENAANFYFSKPASKLTLAESATLAGVIKSPSRYSPISNQENCLKRRNLVLKEMEKDGKISTQEYMDAINSPLGLALSQKKENKLNSYSQASIDEAKKILGLPAKQIALRGYQIHTYQNGEKQQSLENAFQKIGQIDDDYAGIVINNSKHAVEAFTGKSAYKILKAKRQPGSCIKPVLVYGPALNEDIISPCTQLLDEKTTVAGYSPKNVGDTYKGYVSARDALAKSINIPAVKVLSYVGIDKAKKYAENMGIEFDEDDNSYALALGGMNYGVNIKDLANCYSCFANGGKYCQCNFVSYITDSKDRLVYVHRPQETRVMKEDSAYLLTDMLKSSVKNGTARLLSGLPEELASKTGTVGKSGSKENLDAWNMSYTQEQTCGVWLGNLDNKGTAVIGGGTPTEVVKNYFSAVQDSSTFPIPSSIVSMPIDSTELEENHKVVLASSFTPERYKQVELFSRFNLPSEISTTFSTLQSADFRGKVKDGQAVLSFSAKEYYMYKLYKTSVNEQNLIKEFSSVSGKQEITLPMDSPREKYILVISFMPPAPQSESKIESIELVQSRAAARDLSQKWYL